MGKQNHTKKRYTKKRYTKKRYTKKRYTKKRTLKRRSIKKRYTKKRLKKYGGAPKSSCRVYDNGRSKLPFGEKTTIDDLITEPLWREWVEEFRSSTGREPTAEDMCLWGPENRLLTCNWNNCAKLKGQDHSIAGLCTQGRDWGGFVGTRSSYDDKGCPWTKKGLSDYTSTEE